MSSSSQSLGGDLAGKEGREPGATTLQLVPHEECVCLDRSVDGAWIVTHRLTLETLALDEGSWRLVCDEQGFGCLVREHDERTVLLEDLFKKKLFQEEEDAAVMWVKEKQKAGSSRGR